MSKNRIEFDTDKISDVIERLDKAGADLEKILEEVLQEAAEEITSETIDALAHANLPAGGKFSTGDTEDSVVADPKVEKSGTMLEVAVGFDKSKLGAGGWLSTGTPKMPPDKKLADIYTNKRFENKMMKRAKKKLEEEFERIVGG